MNGIKKLMIKIKRKMSKELKKRMKVEIESGMDVM